MLQKQHFTRDLSLYDLGALQYMLRGTQFKGGQGMVGSFRQDLLWQAQTCGMTCMVLLECLSGVAALRAPLSFRLLGGM